MTEVVDETNDELEDYGEDEEAMERVAAPFGRRPVEEPDEATRTADKPLTNQEPIPLLPGSNKKSQRQAVKLKVTKLNPPGHGYKGELHLGADEKYIAQMWGDGTYTVEAINSRGVGLYKREAIRIDMGIEAPEANAAPPIATNGTDTLEVLRQVNVGHAQERARTDRLNRETVETAKELAKEQVGMVKEIAETSRERDATMHRETSERMMTFFEALMERSRIQHQQDMERAKEERIAERERREDERKREAEDAARRHKETLELMSASHERESELLRTTLELQNGADREPWEAAAEFSVKGLQELNKLRTGATPPRRRLPAGGRRRALPSEGSADKEQAPEPRRRRRAPRTDSPSAHMEDRQTEGTRTPTVSGKEIARDIGALKRACDKRGIPFQALLRQAHEQVEAHDPQPQGDTAAESAQGMGPEDTELP